MTRDEETEFAFTEFHKAFADALNALMAKVDARARAEEREACAKVCVNLDLYDPRITAYDCAAAIRARTESERREEFFRKFGND
jgi:hypothetical protein